MKPDNDYSTAGFDDFLSRSVDNLPQQNLDSRGPVNNAIPYDRTQVSGSQGDTLSLGPVKITQNGITMEDDNGNVILLIGNE